MTKTSILLLLVLFAGALSVSLRADSLPPPVVPQCFGVNIHFTGAPAKDLDGIASGGFGWVRMDFVWSAIEQTKGHYDFAAYDTLLDGLTARHIRPLFILDYGNDLYQTGSPRSPEARAAFARFAAAAVSHYRGKPILWEIWNEPNIGFWKPTPSPAEYGALALETARAIKAADPNATVLAPGSSGIPLDFLETVFKTGLLNYVDAVSMHPYRDGMPESAPNDYAAVRVLVHRYAPAGRGIPIVSSEWGYSTVNVSDATQSQYLTRQWLSNLSDGVRLSIWYDWHEDGTDPKDPEAHFGTVRPDYTPKPAFLAAQALTQALNGYRFIKRLSLASGADYVLLFERRTSVKLAAWTAGADHAVQLPGGRTQALTGSPQYADVSGDAALRAAASWSAVPSDTFHTMGRPLQLALTYHNLDTRPHRALMRVSVTTPDGPGKPMDSREATIGAGVAQNWSMPVSGLARVPVSVRVGLTLDGVNQPYEQELAIAPTDPIGVSFAPLPLDRLQVRLENPAETAFTGRLTVQPTGDVKAIPIQLEAGRSSSVLTLPTPPPGSYLILRDAGGLLMTRMPIPRYVPYPVSLDSVRAFLDGDLKLASKAQATASTAPGTELGPDAPALRVSYDFAPGWSFLRASPSDHPPLPGRPAALGVWVYGDGSGNLVRARLQDATGQAFQPSGPDMTWTGWRFVTFTLPTPDGTASIGHWGGANDGVVHYPVSVDTLFLLDSQAGAPLHKGQVWITLPTLVYGRESSPDRSEQ